MLVECRKLIRQAWPKVSSWRQSIVLIDHPLQFRNANVCAIAHNLRQAPPDEGAEVAFVGRSNVGKSSLVNLLTGRRGLARVSGQPGRTQLLFFFEIEPGRRLVDLPGYGYSKANASVTASWGRVLPKYFTQRQSLRTVFLLMDARRPLRDSDAAMLELIAAGGKRVVVVLTKQDKVNRSEAKSAVAAVSQQLSGAVAVLPCSARTGAGVGALLEIVCSELGE